MSCLLIRSLVLYNKFDFLPFLLFLMQYIIHWQNGNNFTNSPFTSSTFTKKRRNGGWPHSNILHQSVKQEIVSCFLRRKNSELLKCLLQREITRLKHTKQTCWKVKKSGENVWKKNTLVEHDTWLCLQSWYDFCFSPKRKKFLFFWDANYLLKKERLESKRKQWKFLDRHKTFLHWKRGQEIRYLKWKRWNDRK